MAVIEELQTAVEDISARVGASVVGVGNGRGYGSGVVVAPGRILTNAHNVRWSTEVVVTLPDDRRVPGTVAGMDLDGDIAIVTADTGDVPAIVWTEDVAAVGIGSPLFALSNPGGRGLRVTFGLVSGTQRSFRGPRGRRIAGSIEHTAPLLPGSSGGPVVDPGGRFVGINTNRLGEGFYLAIPADPALRARADSLARGETASRPRLGIAIVPPEIARRMRRAVGLPDAEGVLVRGVESDGAAARAGVREGDLITHAGDTAIASPDDLFDVLAGAEATLALRVIRGTDSLEVSVTFDR